MQRCDFAEVAQVRALKAAAQPHRLSGAWHAAGILADGMLPKQSAATLRHVYAPKAHGAWALQLASLSAPLSTFTLFSSVVALLGGAGQGQLRSCPMHASMLSHVADALTLRWR